MTDHLTYELASELLKAHAIILAMLKVMPREQRLALHGELKAITHGSLRCITRIDARHAVLAKAGYCRDLDGQLPVQPTKPPVGNWCVKLITGDGAGAPLFYQCHSDVSGAPNFVFDKSIAKRLTLEEAGTVSELLHADGYKRVSIVSAGGQS